MFLILVFFSTILAIVLSFSFGLRKSCSVGEANHHNREFTFLLFNWFFCIFCETTSLIAVLFDFFFFFCRQKLVICIFVSKFLGYELLPHCHQRATKGNANLKYRSHMCSSMSACVTLVYWCVFASAWTDCRLRCSLRFFFLLCKHTDSSAVFNSECLQAALAPLMAGDGELRMPSQNGPVDERLRLFPLHIASKLFSELYRNPLVDCVVQCYFLFLLSNFYSHHFDTYRQKGGLHWILVTFYFFT